MASKEDALIVVNITEVYADISERFPHLGVTLSELSVPTSEFVIKILRAYWYEVFCGVIPNQISDQEMPESYPEVYQGVLPISNLHYLFSIIFEINCCSSFTFSDITHPTPKRTLTLITLVENFAKYCDMKTNALTPVFKEINTRKESYVDMCHQHEQLRQELNNRASNRARREIDTEELLKDHKQTKIKVDNLLKEQNILDDKKCHIQSEIYEVKQKCEYLSQQCHNVDKEKNDLKMQVVSNADELINKLADLKQQLCLKVDEVKEKNEELQLRKSNISQFESIAEGQKYRTKMLKDISMLATCLQTKSNDFQDKESEHKTVKEDIQRSQDKIAMKQESINKLQDQIVRLKLQEDAKASQRKKSMNVLNKDYLDMKANHDDLLRRFTDVQKLRDKSHKELARMEEMKVRVSQHVEKKFASIVTEQEKFDKDVEQKIEAAINHQQLLVNRRNVKN